MQVLDYNEVLKGFSYKPNFHVTAYPRMMGIRTEWWVRCLMYVENSRTLLKPWVPEPYDPMLETDFTYNDLLVPRRTFEEGVVGYSPSRPVVEVTGNFQIPSFSSGDDRQFISWLMYQIYYMERHETDEWARYKGELLNDPHKEI